MSQGDAGARLATLTLDDFTPCVGQSFRVVHESGPLDLRLVSADPAGPAGQKAARRGFSLLLLGPGAPLLGQGIHRLEHHALGALEVFLVPVGADERGVRYEAVFG